MSSQIGDLEPVTRNLCHSVLAAWEEKMLHPIRVTQTSRDYSEQLHLWQQGRRLENGVWVIVAPKLVVTKAPPGESAHNVAAAWDICFQGDDPYLHAHEVEHGVPDPLWAIYGDTVKRFGLVWGGDFKKFPDMPHAERPDWRSLKTAA
jgi:peptidoglycan L-alanyl-D-glutamate endopeptidase CwlK